MTKTSQAIMVIDDDPGVAQLCRRVLERAGYETIALTSPKQGVAVLQHTRIDLLLVDIRMPKMDGYQVMELARKYKPGLAVVVMTGYGTLETAIQALRLGADGLILKPFSEAQELVQSVQRALKERAQKQETARLQVLRPLIEITQSLSAETRLEALVDLSLDAICAHLHSEHAGFYQQIPGEKRLRLTASRGQPLPEEESDLAGGPVARAAAWGVPLRVNRQDEDEPELTAALAARGMEAIMCAPAFRNPEGNSVLLAGRSAGDGGFTDADFEMFTILARQVSIAMENAQLYAELRDYVRQIENSQRALIQAEKMAAIGRITASIAHEVNNPLQAVQNCLHLAGRSELSAEKQQHYLGLAQTELNRLMSTVQQMLVYFRPGAVNREFADINQLLARVLAILEQQLYKKNIEIVKQFKEPLPLVFVVSNQIQQVFFNIIINAMEAISANGGKIVINTCQNPNSIEITFVDTGPGVPAEQQEHIFEPFMSTKEKGTGLGLSVSYGIVEAHGGKLELLTNQGQGAQFSVTLPYKDEP